MNQKNNQMKNKIRNLFSLRNILILLVLLLLIGLIVAPALYEVISTSTGGFFNSTETTNIGLRNMAPVLLMDFNEEPVGTRVRDNSIYGNDGVLP